MKRNIHRNLGKHKFAAAIAGLLVVIMAMVALDKCSRSARNPFGATLPEKSGGDTIDVAIEISPVSYSLAHDTITGLDYEIWRGISAMTGRPVKFHPFAPMSYALQGLDEGRFDVVVASLASTESLKQHVTPTTRVYLDHEILLQRTDSPRFVHSADALAGDTVWVADGSPFVERLHNLAEEIGDTIVILQKHGYTAEHLALLVADGVLERAVVNSAVAKALQSDHPNLDASTQISFTQFQVWGVKRGNNAMRDSIDTWLNHYRRTPDFATLIRRYNVRP